MCSACCVFSLESPHRGDSNEYTQHAIINIKKNHTKLSQIYKCLQLCDFSLGTQEQVPNSRGKRAIGVRAIEVRLYDFSSLHECKVIFYEKKSFFKVWKNQTNTQDKAGWRFHNTISRYKSISHI